LNAVEKIEWKPTNEQKRGQKVVLETLLGRSAAASVVFCPSCAFYGLSNMHENYSWKNPDANFSGVTENHVGIFHPNPPDLPSRMCQKLGQQVEISRILSAGNENRIERAAFNGMLLCVGSFFIRFVAEMKFLPTHFSASLPFLSAWDQFSESHWTNDDNLWTQKVLKQHKCCGIIFHHYFALKARGDENRFGRRMLGNMMNVEN
jgi:hypothetical protein